MSTIHPTINIRMAVLDICEVTGWTEQDALSLLCDRLDQGFMNRLNLDIDAINLQYDTYTFPARQAVNYLSCIRDGSLNWEFATDAATDQYGRPSPERIPIERFCLTPRELYLIVNPVIDFEKFGLSKKWSIYVPYVPQRIAASHRSGIPGSW